MNDLTQAPGTEIVGFDGNGGGLVNQIQQGAAVQRVGGQYATAIAVQKARVLPLVEKNVLYEAAKLGESCYYGWGAGKDRVEGPTVKLAMMIARQWGNSAIELLPVQDTREAWIFTASFVDLETGFTLQRQFRQSKQWTVHGKFDQARKEDIRFQIGQSKAVRNVILNAVPDWLVDRAIDVAKGGVRENIEKAIKERGIADVIAGAISKLKGYGIDETRVLLAFGRKTPAALTVEDLVTIAGSVKALSTGAELPEDVFPMPAAEGSKQQTNGNKLDQLADDLSGKTKEQPTDSGERMPIAEVGDLMAGCTKAGFSDLELAGFLKANFNGKQSIDDLMPEEGVKLRGMLDKLIDQPAKPVDTGAERKGGKKQ